MDVKSDLWRRWRIIGPTLAVSLLAIGLAITGTTVASGRQNRIRSMFLQHTELTAAATNFMIMTYVSFVPAAITARQVVLDNIRAFNDSTLAPLQPVLRSLAGSFAHTGVSFVAVGVIGEAERALYEAGLTAKCAAVLRTSNLSIASIDDPVAGRASLTPLPPRPNGYYPLIMDVAIAGATDVRSACNNPGLDFGTSLPRMRVFMEAVDSSMLTWQSPLPVRAPTNPLLNIGLLMPLHAPTRECAGRAGLAHFGLLAARPDVQALLPPGCNRSSLGSVNDTACGRWGGQAPRALGAVSIPMYPTVPLRTVAGAVPNIKSCHILLLYVPPSLEGLLQLASPESVGSTPPPFPRAGHEPLPDSAYLAETYAQRTSWALRHDGLGPLLRATTPGRVLLSIEYTNSSNQDSAGALGPWAPTDAEEALGSALRAGGEEASLQAATAFVLGANTYVLILRDKRSVDTSDFLASQGLTWTLGGLLTVFVAVALPCLAHLLIRQQERQHAVQMALLQSEKDGVVQAVAFAAHEIRNPMHGVLASLDTALTDLQPVIDLMQKALTVGVSRLQPERGPEEGARKPAEPAVCSAVLQTLGLAGCETALLALEDVAVAKSSAESCHWLINDMVDYSKLQRGAISIQMGHMDVRISLRALLEAQRAFLQTSVRTFMAVHADVPDVLRTDQVRIMQVITNGLTNAGKFTTMGEIYCTCMMQHTGNVPALCMPHNPSNRWVCFVVCDTGKGLAGIDVDSLFEPITPRSERGKGTGVAKWRGAASAVVAHLRAMFTRRAGTSAATTSAADGESTECAATPDDSNEGGTRSVATPTDSQPAVQAVSASSVAKSRGSGLGLPVARLMARAMGGDVDLYTEPNNRLGIPLTRFVFLLPESAVDGSRASAVHYPLFGRSGLLPPHARQAFRQKIIGKLASDFHVVEELASEHEGPLKAVTGCVAQYLSRNQKGRGSGAGQAGEAAERAEGTSTTSFAKPDPAVPHVCPCGPADPTAPSAVTTTTSGSFPRRPDVGAGSNTTRSALSLDGSLTSSSNGNGSPAERLDAAPEEDEQTADSDDVLVTVVAVGTRASRASRAALYGPSPASAPVRRAEGSKTGMQAPPIDTALGTSDPGTESFLPVPAPAALLASTGGALQTTARLTTGPRLPARIIDGQDSTDTASSDGSTASSLPRAAAEVQSMSLVGRVGGPSAPSSALVPASLRASMTTQQSRGEAGAAHMRVLYAEDDCTNRRLMERMLSRISVQGGAEGGVFAGVGSGRAQRVEATTAVDGWEALCVLYVHGHVDAQTLRKAQRLASSTEGELQLPDVPESLTGHGAGRLPFHVILLDVDMPRVSGDQVAAYLQAARRAAAGKGELERVPIIAVTGRAVGMTVTRRLLERCDSGTGQALLEGVQVVDSLPDAALNGVFDGSLGKPFKLQYLQLLLNLAVQSPSLTPPTTA